MDRSGVFHQGMTRLAAFLVILCLPAAIAGHRYADTSLIAAWQEPSAAHWLGCDVLGRDILSRLLVAAPVSIGVAVVSLAIAVPAGGALGLLAASTGGWVEALVLWALDGLMAFPRLVLALALVAAFGPGLVPIVLGLGIAMVPVLALLTRALAAKALQETYVLAAVALGVTPVALVWRHLLPAVWPGLLNRSASMIAVILMSEATLSFLGLGIQEPLPSWGGMIRDGLAMAAPTLAVPASLALALAIGLVNLALDRPATAR